MSMNRLIADKDNVVRQRSAVHREPGIPSEPLIQHLAPLFIVHGAFWWFLALLAVTGLRLQTGS